MSAAESMDEIGADEKGRGEESSNPRPEETPKSMEPLNPTEPSKPTETPKPPATPIQPPGWDKLIPRMSPLLGPQYQVRAQAHPKPDETTQSKRREADVKCIQTMFFNQYIPHTAHDINLALHANQAIAPGKKIRPPKQGSRESKYIREQTVQWSERRKCQLLNIIPGEGLDVVHRPKCSEEVKFLDRHARKQAHPHHLRTTMGTHGVYPERTFNGLLSEEEWKQTTFRDVKEWGVAPPYSMSSGNGTTGKRTELRGGVAYRAQFRGYNDEFKTGSTGMMRRHFFPGSHHIEAVGAEDVAVLQGQAFMVYSSGQESGVGYPYQRESSIDWLDAGATMQAGDSLFWEEDTVFQRNGREDEGSAESWVSENVANDDAFERVLGDVDLSAERYVQRSFGRWRTRDVEMERGELQSVRAHLYEGM